MQEYITFTATWIIDGSKRTMQVDAVNKEHAFAKIISDPIESLLLLYEFKVEFDLGIFNADLLIWVY